MTSVRATTRMTMLSSTAPASSNPAPTSDLFRGFSSISNRLTDRLAASGITSGVSANFENLISGVKNFLPVDRDLTVTKICESIMDPAGASSSAIAKTEGYLYFDPRSANARGTMPPASALRRDGSNNSSSMPGGLGSLGPGTGATFGQRRQGFSDAIVFTVGGGTIGEYGNLQDWARRTGQGGGADKGLGKRRVLYGSTELLNAEEFLAGDLMKLGAECRE
jgi:hypothetical protein